MRADGSAGQEALLMTRAEREGGARAEHKEKSGGMRRAQEEGSIVMDVKRRRSKGQVRARFDELGDHSPVHKDRNPDRSLSRSSRSSLHTSHAHYA